MSERTTSVAVPTLHELDLGQHILIILSEVSIDLLAHDEQTPSSNVWPVDEHGRGRGSFPVQLHPVGKTINSPFLMHKIAN